MQTTLKSSVSFHGVGLHSGKRIDMKVRPAGGGTGIWFCRTDVQGKDPMVPALWDSVSSTDLCTVIENAEGVSVSTVEHVMAALFGAGVHNAIIEVNAPEVPILDGSSADFLARFKRVGVKRTASPIDAIEILKEVEVSNKHGFARLEPSSRFEVDFAIDFDAPSIGYQHLNLEMTAETFAGEVADCRTFCLKSDVDHMRKAGLALGGTLHNALVFDQGGVLSPGGKRRADEAVRHKILDAVGDLNLAGGPIIGRYVGHRAGHGLTNQVLRELFSDRSQYRIISTRHAPARVLSGFHAKIHEHNLVA